MMRKSVVLLGIVAMMAAPTYAAVIGYSVQSNGNDHLYQIDMETGASVDLGLVGLNDAEGVGFKGTDLYAIGGTVEEFWNITTPPGVMVGPTGNREGIDAGLAYDTTRGKMFNFQGNIGGSYLYEINVGTGAATFVGQSNAFGDSLAVWNGQGYTADFIFADSLYKVNLGTGAQTLVGPLNIGNVSLQSGLSFDPTGQLWAITSDGKTYKLNANTGAATFVANVSAGAGWEGLGIIPEPTSLCLLGIGLLALIRRR